jgi:hypothetical protein
MALERRSIQDEVRKIRKAAMHNLSLLLQLIPTITDGSQGICEEANKCRHARNLNPGLIEIVSSLRPLASTLMGFFPVERYRLLQVQFK